MTANLLHAQGQTPDMMRFTDSTAVAPLADSIRAYLHEAIGYTDTGITAAKVHNDLNWPSPFIRLHRDGRRAIF